MAKKGAKNRTQKPQKVVKKESSEPRPVVDEAEVERVYKIITRTMSWIVGVCFILIIILPMFNNPVLDLITKILYYIGISNLVIFIVIEIVNNSFKRLIGHLVGKKAHA